MQLELLLRRSPALRDLGDEDVALLVAELIEGTHRAGHLFIQEGTHGDEVFLLVEGEVAVLRGGNELHRLRPGALFGLVAHVDEGVRGATCRAVGECRVARMSRQRLEDLQERSPALALAVQRSVVRQLAADFRHLNGLIRDKVGEFGARLLKK